MINKVILIGNLGKDPEIRHLESGISVGKFPIATNESYKDKNGEWQTLTEWHDIVVWRGLAERAERDLKKGSLVYIDGKLTHRKWQDRDGNDRYTTEIVANTFRILDRKTGERSGYSDDFPSESNDRGSTLVDLPAPDKIAKEVSDTEDDDLPF